MEFITIGNHTINLERVCGFQVYGREDQNCTIVEVEYEHSTHEIPCAGCYSKVINDLREALRKYCIVIQGPEIYTGD